MNSNLKPEIDESTRAEMNCLSWFQRLPLGRSSSGARVISPDPGRVAPAISAVLGSLVGRAWSLLEQRFQPQPVGPSVAVPAPVTAPGGVTAPYNDFDPATVPWIDRPDADVDAYVRGLSSLPQEYDLRAQLHHWREQGFVVFRGAAYGNPRSPTEEDLFGGATTAS